MSDVVLNIGWAIAFSCIGGLTGVALLMAATKFIPKFLDTMTPAMDEDKEIARGNRAVAEYFGRIVSATIIGVSIVIAAAILAGVIVALS